MNFRKKKKKGSSLLIVIALMAVVSIITISVLAMTTSGYKMRRDSNKRMENFYGADSGIEISERVLINYIESAIDYSNKEVDKYVADNTVPNPDGGYIEPNMEEKKLHFRKSFVNFFNNGGKSLVKPFYDSDRSEYDYLKVIQEVARQDYYDSLSREDVKIITDDSKLVFKNKKGEILDKSSLDAEKVNSLTLGIQSDYIKEEKQRSVSVDFDIIVPEYGKEIVKYKGAESPKILDYIVGVDGSYNLELNNTSNIYGDIWVKGERASQGQVLVENKYDNGVNIFSNTGNKPEISHNGGIATGGTINLRDINYSVDKATNKGMYARNLKVENTAREGTENSNMKTDLSAVDVSIYNDMFLKGDNNVVNMKNYYGLNDLNTDKYKDLFNSMDEISKSSSMLIEVDSEDNQIGSKINVAGDAFVLGTSYVNLGEESYQTGQSNSINRLTKPYTIRNNEKYIYDYKGNLHLVDKKQDGSDISVSEKIELFENYIMSEEEKRLAGVLNVTGNLYNTGVMFEKGTMKSPNYMTLPKNTVEAKQKDFAKEVFNMGEEGSYSVYDYWSNKFETSVKDSFKFDDFPAVIEAASKTTNAEYELLAKSSDYKVGILQTKKSILDIMKKAKADKSKTYNIEAYGDVNSSEKPIIILSSSEKPIEIIEMTSGGNKIEDNGQIIKCFVNVVDLQLKAPILLISNSDINYTPKGAYVYTMFITTGDINYKVDKNGAIIGNYNFQSDSTVPGYKEGQFNLVNELFKYILEDSDLMGGIGEGIFGGTAKKEVIESVEIPDILDKKNWQLIK